MSPYRLSGNTTAAKRCLIRLPGYNGENLFPDTRELVAVEFSFVEKTVVISNKLKEIQ